MPRELFGLRMFQSTSIRKKKQEVQSMARRQPQKMQRRRLAASPADNHEDHKLECSGFGKSPNGPSSGKNSPPAQTSTVVPMRDKVNVSAG